MVDVVVVGAGAAGLIAATEAARGGARVLLLDKNRQPGVKILASGGTRCNLTHDCDRDAIVQAFGPGGRFLVPALHVLSPEQLRARVESLGVPTWVEPGGKVFPASNRARDVRDAFWEDARRAGAVFRGRAPVRELSRCEGGFRLRLDEETLEAPVVILTTGGQSYPGTGTTGDGYPIAEALGHRVLTPRPALVPLIVAEPWLTDLAGVTLPDARLDLWQGGRRRETRRGSTLITHFGLSGPAPMDLGGTVASTSRAERRVTLCVLPDTSPEELEAAWQAAAAAEGRRPLSAVLPKSLPRRLLRGILQRVSLSADLPIAQLRRTDRRVLAHALTGLELDVTGTQDFTRAEVTRGGVDRADVDRRTMQSRRCPGLFFAGEVLDVDGPIGGYNFTAAFATGALAGQQAARLRP